MCPECESIQGVPLDKGRDVHGRPLRDYRCRDCGTRYSTIESTLPVRMFVLDEERKIRNRLEERTRRGIQSGFRLRKPTPEVVVWLEMAE